MRDVLAALLLAGGAPVTPSPAPAASVSVLHVEIPVADLARATRFYEALLGVRGDPATIDGYRMLMFPIADGAAGASLALVAGDVYRPGRHGPVVYLRAPDLDGLLARAAGLGARLLYPKKRLDDGRHLAEIEDSEGNRIALMEP